MLHALLRSRQSRKPRLAAISPDLAHTARRQGTTDARPALQTRISGRPAHQQSGRHRHLRLAAIFPSRRVRSGHQLHLGQRLATEYRNAVLNPTRVGSGGLNEQLKVLHRGRLRKERPDNGAPVGEQRPLPKRHGVILQRLPINHQ